MIDAFLDLAVADNLETTFSTPPLPYEAEQMREMANSSYAIPGISDGGAHTKFMTFGAYPTEFLTRVWQSGALFGRTAKEAFYVKIDEELNPPAVRALGQVIVEIGMAPVRPAEFVVVRIGIWDGGAQVSEG